MTQSYESVHENEIIARMNPGRSRGSVSGFSHFASFASAYCWTGACCCGSGSWACVLPIGAEATSLVHTSWNTTRLSGVYSLVRQVQGRGATATAGVTA